MADIDRDLLKVLNWAKQSLQDEDLPPWTWYNYMKLHEAVDAVVKGRAVRTASLQPRAQHRGVHLRPVDENYQPDNARHAASSEAPPLPM